MTMDDQFLHRLRRDPPAGFASRLKRQLDRPTPVRPSRTQLILALAIFGTAFALTATPVRQTLATWFSKSTETTSQTEARRRIETPATAASSAAALAGSRKAMPSARPAPRRSVALPIIPTQDFANPPSPTPAPVVAETAPVTATPSPAVSVTSTALILTPGLRAAVAATTRQGLFKVLSWVTQPLYQMARGTVPFDEPRLARSADTLQQLAPLIPEVFQSDTHLSDVPTAALPNIWTEYDAFAAKAADLTAAADGLAAAAAAHDREASLKALGQVAAACNACHTAYMKR
jgi:cytochrome c556